MVSPLIAASELAAVLGESRPSLLDVRWSLGGPPGIDAYRRGHIPGAAFVDLDRDLAAPPGPGRHPLPEPADFAAAMRRAGVSNTRAVVVYDAADGIAAARAWWLLRHFGHPEVRVLDGGFAQWERAGLPVAAGDDAVEAGDFTSGPGLMPVIDAEAAAVLARRGVLLDVRSAERFRGEREPVDPVAGHIPGARNLPEASLIGEDGRLLSVPALRSLFAAAGVRPEVKVAAYCGSGVTASHAVLALEVAGIAAALYPGSWSEWITDPGRPVATGSAD